MAKRTKTQEAPTIELTPVKLPIHTVLAGEPVTITETPPKKTEVHTPTDTDDVETWSVSTPSTFEGGPSRKEVLWARVKGCTVPKSKLDLLYALKDRLVYLTPLENPDASSPQKFIGRYERFEGIPADNCKNWNGAVVFSEVVCPDDLDYTHAATYDFPWDELKKGA